MEYDNTDNADLHLTTQPRDQQTHHCVVYLSLSGKYISFRTGYQLHSEEYIVFWENGLIRPKNLVLEQEFTKSNFLSNNRISDSHFIDVIYFKNNQF